MEVVVGGVALPCQLLSGWCHAVGDSLFGWLLLRLMMSVAGVD